MNELKTFNFESHEVRTVLVNNEPWFVGKDVATILGYKNTKDALTKHVDEDDKLGSRITTSGQAREMTTINESGVYSLIFGSKLDSAKRFKQWVTSEVLPSVRKHGAYMTSEKIEEVLTNPDTIIRLATELKNERQEKLQYQSQVTVMTPKAEFYDKVADAKEVFYVKQLADHLAQNGHHTGQNLLFKELVRDGYLRKLKNGYAPTSYANTRKLFKTIQTTYERTDGAHTSTTVMVTAKGMQYFVKKYCEQKELAQ
ncbi:KilAC domain (KilAC) [Fructobacillus tropaeoli]|uniref:phage antirepressor n=1 Tax=Fructobacillus tropaeoli TaxID=709323 RepID=UPI002DAC108C|nr:KilAC domain (KilAC) [Fructobacillus tropaeoli]